MSHDIGPLECPFCNTVFLTSVSPRTRKLRTCTRCHRQFFYFKGMYFISKKDVHGLKKELVYEKLLKKK
jgi:hypothetical protein